MSVLALLDPLGNFARFSPEHDWLVAKPPASST